MSIANMIYAYVTGNRKKKTYTTSLWRYHHVEVSMVKNTNNNNKKDVFVRFFLFIFNDSIVIVFVMWHTREQQIVSPFETWYLSSPTGRKKKKKKSKDTAQCCSCVKKRFLQSNLHKLLYQFRVFHLMEMSIKWKWNFNWNFILLNSLGNLKIYTVFFLYLNL